VATQINNYTREDVTQATPPIKVARMVLSMAASARDHRGQHMCLIGRHDIRVAFFHAKGSGNVVMVPAKGLAPPGVGWRALKAMYGTREASKCWGDTVTDTMLAAGCEAVMVVPMTFVHKDHGYVVECHGDDFLSCGSAAALDHLDKVLTEKFDTKVLPRVGPPAHGGQATEGPHLGRIVRWTPEGFEWESNPKHYKDLMELCGLKDGSKGSDVPISKTVGKGMRNAIDELNSEEANLFRQAAGTGLYLSIDRPSLQYAMSETMGGMQTPLVKHKLMVHHIARYVARYPAEVWLFKYQIMPAILRIFTDSDWAGNSETRKSVSCAVENFGTHMLECSVGKQSIVALSSAEAEFYAIVRGTSMGMQTLQILEMMVGVFSQTVEKDDDKKLVSLRVSSDSSAARAICNRVGSGKVRHLSIKELWIQEEVRKKRLALDSVDTSMNWGDIGTKAHPKDRLDSLMNQLPLRRTGGVQSTVLGALVFATSVAAARAEDPEMPGVAWTAKIGDSYLVVNLAAVEVMAIVILVFVLSVAFLALCCWSCTCMRNRPGSAQPDRARPSPTDEPAESDPSAASAARGILEGALEAEQELPEGPARRREQLPASRGESADQALASPVRVREHRAAAPECECERCVSARDHTELMENLSRYTLKALQQTCRDLHIKIGGPKEDVVRRIAAHMMHQEYAQRAASGATSRPQGMSRSSSSEGNGVA
jgi:KUP system potassium uptake protein